MKVVKENGLICAVCPWINFCRGCVIQCNDEPLLQDSCYNDNTSSEYTFYQLVINYQYSLHFVNIFIVEILYATNITQQANVFEKKIHNEEQCFTKISLKLPKDNENLGPLSQFFIAIDWDPTALHLRYQSSLEKV